MSDFEYIRQTTLRSIKKNFLQHCNLSPNEAIKVWANWIIVNRVREKQLDEFLPTENLELDNKTTSLLIEKGMPEDEAINFYSNLIQQCQRWKYRYEYYCADNPCSSCDNHNNNITLSVIDDKGVFPPGFPVQAKIVYGLGDTMHQPCLSLTFSTSSTSTPPSTLTYVTSSTSTTNTSTVGIGIAGIDIDIVIDYKGISNRIDSLSLKRLLADYRGHSHHQKNKKDRDEKDNNLECSNEFEVRLSVWKLLNNYMLLDGLSYQWSLPPETFKLLSNKCDLKAELFASPLNHHVKNYYSLFEIDKEFGSSGDFFHSTYNDFSKGGFYEANPPFIESIFVRASHLILNYLEIARNNTNKDNAGLMFMWIMPDWLDSYAYKRLRNSRFFRTELVFKKGLHKYWEYRKNRLIQANFNTYVLILSSSHNYYQNMWPISIEKEFVRSMSI